VGTFAATAAAFRPLHFAAAEVYLSGGMHTATDTAAALRVLQYEAAAAGALERVCVHCCCFCYSLQAVALCRCRWVLQRGGGGCALLLLLLLLLQHFGEQLTVFLCRMDWFAAPPPSLHVGWAPVKPLKGRLQFAARICSRSPDIACGVCI
jgi:hypothetical protein